MSLFAAGSIAVLVVFAAVFLLLRSRTRDPELRVYLDLRRQDGWSQLNFSLENRHDTKVWVERAAFVITALRAEMPGAPAPEQGCLKIRENLRVGEALRISAIEAVYNAAGKPQGNYSFAFKGAVRYRLGDRWMEAETPACSVDMIRLSAKRVRLERNNPALDSQSALTAKLRSLLDETEEKGSAEPNIEKTSSTAAENNPTLARHSA